jgi:hypothetical protein
MAKDKPKEHLPGYIQQLHDLLAQSNKRIEQLEKRLTKLERRTRCR